MKKAFSIFLIIILLFPTFIVNASSNKFYEIKFDLGEGAFKEKILVEDNEIYLPANSFSTITRYSFDDEDNLFLIKGQEFEKAYKYVFINKSKKEIHVNGTYKIKLTNLKTIDNELYLPLSQMLPILSAEIFEIKNNTIYIANNKLSLAEVLYDFNILNTYYNISKEYADNAGLALLGVVPNYVLNTILDMRIDRLNVVSHIGEYNDYKKIFSEILADDNLYLKAKAVDEDLVDLTIDAFKFGNETYSSIRSYYEWVEAAGTTSVDIDGGVLLEALKDYYDSDAIKVDDLKQFNDVWTNGHVSFADGFDFIVYVYTYLNVVEDNKKMLDAVYDVNSYVSKREIERKAAKQVYDLYSDKVEPAITEEITHRVIKHSIEFLNPYAVYTSALSLSNSLIENFVFYSPEDVSLLPQYANVVLSASSSYGQYDTRTDESTEKLRLSLLLSLIASRKCFSIMDETNLGDSTYYKNKIKKLETLIMGLYIASDNVKLDSYEHFDEYKNKNMDLISKSGILENLIEIEEDESTKDNPFNSEMAINIKPGKYKGFWGDVNRPGVYGYITINGDGTFHIETNANHKTGEKTDLLIADGTYTTNSFTDYYPDGTMYNGYNVTFYIDDEVFIGYMCGEDWFTDQWSGYFYES